MVMTRIFYGLHGGLKHKLQNVGALFIQDSQSLDSVTTDSLLMTEKVRTQNRKAAVHTGVPAVSFLVPSYTYFAF
jgi:hypothetical protein